MFVCNEYGYQKGEYLLLIDIPEVLRNKIEKARTAMTEQYPVHQPKTGRSHIGLVRFTALQQQEDKIINRLQSIAMGQQPFMIELRGFGGYPMHCIYISICRAEKIKQLIRAFKEARWLLKANDESPYFFEDPVIPLTARMDKDIYIAAMKEYARKHFSGHFIVSSILLLKRKEKNERYKIIKRFELESLPVGIKQGELF